MLASNPSSGGATASSGGTGGGGISTAATSLEDRAGPARPCEDVPRAPSSSSIALPKSAAPPCRPTPLPYGPAGPSREGPPSQGVPRRYPNRRQLNCRHSTSRTCRLQPPSPRVSHECRLCPTDRSSLLDAALPHSSRARGRSIIGCRRAHQTSVADIRCKARSLAVRGSLSRGDHPANRSCRRQLSSAGGAAAMAPTSGTSAQRRSANKERIVDTRIPGSNLSMSGSAMCSYGAM